MTSDSLLDPSQWRMDWYLESLAGVDPVLVYMWFSGGQLEPPADFNQYRLGDCRVCGDVFLTRATRQRICSRCKPQHLKTYRAKQIRTTACGQCGSLCAGRKCRGCASTQLLSARTCACGNSKYEKAERCLTCRRMFERSTHRESVRRHRRRSAGIRRNRLRNVGATSEVGRWRRICERDDWTCWLCRRSIDRSLAAPNRMSGTADHVVALALGGDDSDENLRAAHFGCNSKRGSRTGGAEEKVAETRPRTDRKSVV